MVPVRNLMRRSILFLSLLLSALPPGEVQAFRARRGLPRVERPVETSEEMELAFSFYATGGVATREKDEGDIQRRDAADRYMRNSKTALAEKQRMQMVRARDEHSELHNKEKKKWALFIECEANH